ncbi:MAG: sugar phosphate nucleotidyltransferase [Patescibacteria group bacterium]
MRPHLKHKETSRRPLLPDCIVLCGGQGTRLRRILSHLPKALAPVGERAFLDLLLDLLARQGMRRAILCVGHLGALIREHLRSDARVVFSEELEPLGTGGALRLALPLAGGERALVLNGDTFCPVDLSALLRFHRDRRAALTVVLSRSSRSDGGSVALSSDGRITDFSEKKRPGAERYLNAGIYCFDKRAARRFPSESAFSLELDFFPKLLRRATCYGFVTDEPVIDIGTPARYRAAKEYFKDAKHRSRDEKSD